MDWYPQKKAEGNDADDEEEREEFEQEMEDPSWEQQQDNENQEWMEQEQEDENQWYQDWGAGDGEEWRQNADEEPPGVNPEEDWENGYQEYDPQEWGEMEYPDQDQDGKENAPAEEDMQNEEPISAPPLAPIRAGHGKAGPRFAPLNAGKGKGGSEKGKATIGYPSPLTHPSAKQNPLLRDGGENRPISRPIFDPQHPMNRERGWTPNPYQWQQMNQPVMGWIPPAPPAPQPIGFGYRPQQQVGGHGPNVPGLEWGQQMGMWQQRYPATPQMQRSFSSNARIMFEEDTGNEPSNESGASAHMQTQGNRRTVRRRTTHESSQKRQVMLNIGGREVLASFWEP